MSNYVGRGAYTICPRCGTRRQRGATNAGQLCGDCRYVEPNWPILESKDVPRVTALAVARARLRQLDRLAAKVDRERDTLARSIAAVEAMREARGKARTRRKVAACGTESGYSRHRRLDEPACEECKAAWRKGEAQRSARRAFRKAYL